MAVTPLSWDSGHARMQALRRGGAVASDATSVCSKAGAVSLALGNALNCTKLGRNSAAGNEPVHVKKKEKTMLEERP
jgi:hypothetical protein